MHISAAARSGLKVEFEVAVVLRNFDKMIESGITQRGASKIGVKNDARRIDHRAERVTLPSSELLGNSVRQQFDALLQAIFGVFS